MTSDMLLGLLIGAVLFVSGLALAGLCLWWRAGRTEGARWWVRCEPHPQDRMRPHHEGLALVLIPVFAETLMLLALVAVLGPMLAPVSGPTLTLALVVALAQAVLYGVAHFATWQRWILPLWAYPSWLLQTRRAEAEHLRAQRRGRR